MSRILIGVVLALSLLACEKPQNGPSGRRSDTAAWDAAQDPFVAPGWKSGDEAGWESQIRNRTAWQNEYSRISPQQ